MQTSQLADHIQGFWDRDIIPTLHDYIRIPNESPMFDPDWKANGHMDKAVQLVSDWIGQQNVPGGHLQVFQDGDRTPVMLLEFPGEIDNTILFYGHLDKQPPMVGWREGLGPWTPHLDDEGRLYGRGGGDDGYAIWAR